MVGIPRAKRLSGFFYKPVNEKNQINKTTQYGFVKSADKTNTHLSDQNATDYNLLEDLDHRIGDLKKTYRQYNRDEQELEENLKQLSDRSKKLVMRLSKLLEAYNQAVVSLRAFDQAFKTDNMLDIESLLQRNKYHLKTLGFMVNPDSTIELDADLFLDQVMEDDTIFPYLFSNKHGFFIKLCNIFKHIRIPTDKSQHYSQNSLQVSILNQHI